MSLASGRLSVIKQDEAKAIIKEVGTGVVQWRDVAQSYGLDKREIERMVSAFEHADAQAAGAI